MVLRKIKELRLNPRGLIALLALPLILGLAFAASAQVGQDDPNQAPPAAEAVPPAQEPAPTVPPAPPGMEGQVTYSANGEWISNAEIGMAPALDSAAAPQAAAASGVLDGMRHVYISINNYNGAQADTGCAEGYHMASLWEMLDATHIVYDQIPGVSKTQADMGTGPVANWWGWVRTGGVSSVVNTAGTANCSVWTSNTTGEYGSIVRLSTSWTTGSTDILSWDAQTWSCSGLAPVWCVRD